MQPPLIRALSAIAVVSQFLFVAVVFANVDPARLSGSGDRYFVIFEEPGAYHYRGGVADLPGTANERSGMKFDASRSEVIRYRNHLRELRAQRLEQIEELLSRELSFAYEYDVVFHGAVLAPLSSAEVALISRLPSVRRVEVVRDYELASDRGPWFIGADTLWGGSPSLGGAGFRGEGLVLAVLDTGIAFQHPSFTDDPACGFSAQNPKLIAARGCFLSPTCTGFDPYDSNGHGTLVASIAVGNRHRVEFGDYEGSLISGVAPCAQLISYNICNINNQCDAGAVQWATQNALIDQVDALSFALLGGNNPWSPTDADFGFLTLVDAGIFVAAAAGNNSESMPNPIGRVAHRGPWVMTVASTSLDRATSNRVDVAGGPQNIYSLRGLGPFPADITAMLADAQTLGNSQGCSAGGGFATGSMSGRIALISRGNCNFSEKIDNAAAAGAIGVIVHNHIEGPPVVMGLTDTTTIPGVMISLASGQAIRNHIAANPTASVFVSATTARNFHPEVADFLSVYSLRGPVADDIEVTKPDIAAPGVDILGASSLWLTPYEVRSGTSMAAAHVAGAGLLVKGLNPDWTAIEVKSALQLTAFNNGFKDYYFGVPNSGPWDADDVGNGRLDVSKAARAGLVMDESTANFLAAEGNRAAQRALNLPSMRNTSCTPDCTFVRTVRNTLDGGSNWSVTAVDPDPRIEIEVTPASFSFSGEPTETQELTIRVSPIGDQTAAVVFGEVVMTEGRSQSPLLHMTVAVRGNSDGREDEIFTSGFEGATLQ